MGVFIMQPYEDDYSHSEIDDAKVELIEKISNYLSLNRPGEFIVSDGWCVLVMTPDRARESRISENTIENHLVK